MSENWDIDVDHEDYEDAPRALRDAYKSLKKRLDTVTTERDDFRSKWQTKAASDALSGYGFRNPKRVSKDMQADGIDVSDADAVKAWVEDNGDDYAKGEAAPAAEPTENADPAEVQARQAASQVQNLASPAGTDKITAALAEITPEMTGEQVQAIYRKHGL